MNNILRNGALLPTCQEARCLYISPGSEKNILNIYFGVRRIATRWIPNLLTDDQKRDDVSIARNLLKMHLKFNQK